MALKKIIFYCLAILILFTNLIFVSANSFILNEKDLNPHQQKNNLKFLIDKLNNKTSIHKENSFGGVASNQIEIIWPEPGYYYIADYMQLQIDTANPSTCSYSFNGAGFETMEETGGTTHYHTLFDLVDNMQGDAYVVDFRCFNGGESTAQTWFWINTTDLDAYFIRQDIEDWEYIASQTLGGAEEYNLLEFYQANYGMVQNMIYTNVGILIFDNENYLKNFVDELLNEDLNETIKIIDGQNVYFYKDNNTGQYAMWNDGNELIYLVTYPYENSTPVNVEVPLTIIRPYLNKYPSEVRNGICGDGKVDVLNEDGQREECDKNFEVESCSLDIGMCTIGERRRECSSSCMWENWGECVIINSSNEVCGDLDNDCDGEIDEGGVCFNNVLKIDINSPNKHLYNNTKIQFNITTSEQVNKISYIDWTNPQREITLCSNCNGYGFTKKKIKPFKDGQHNLTIKAAKDNETMEKNISFRLIAKNQKFQRQNLS